MSAPAESTMAALADLSNEINTRVPGEHARHPVAVMVTDALPAAAVFLRKENSKGAPWEKQSNGAPVLAKGSGDANISNGLATVIFPLENV